MSTWPPTPNQPGPAMGPLPPSPPSSNNNTPLVVGLVVLLVAVVGAAGVFLLSGDDDGDDSENASNRREREEQTEDCASEESQSMDGTNDAQSQDSCAQPPEDVEVDAPPTTEGTDTEVVESGPSSSDVLDALASDVYASTPGSIDTDTAFCLAEVIYDVVGESTVVAADADYDDIYAGTSLDEDAEISEGGYSCTTVQQDDDLAASSSWPAAWVPTSDGSGASGGGSSSSSGDVLDALASDVYASTPGSIDTDTAACLAEVIYSVVGESVVAAAGADYQVIYSGTSATEDDLISEGAYSCTTVAQDSDLAASSSWPGPWTPAP